MFYSKKISKLKKYIFWNAECEISTSIVLENKTVSLRHPVYLALLENYEPSAIKHNKRVLILSTPLPESNE